MSGHPDEWFIAHQVVEGMGSFCKVLYEFLVDVDYSEESSYASLCLRSVFVKDHLNF